ncbi:ribonuclease H-like protein [Periconia macrospinosa]|uniref:ribonuclease H n=1 Tax=Periconia macrospinosa TaxID=97972 RepID=A0A2V1E828_9PLEO|nr:ribonuclease H-like protein [Periconia macrospinosa]
MAKTPKKTQGYSPRLPTKFNSLSRENVPDDLFSPAIVGFRFPRYVHNKDRTMRLVYTDGACINNGQPDARAGWAMVACPPRFQGGPNSSVNFCGRLENRGPAGHYEPQTSNRAELRAVLAALGSRDWSEDRSKREEGCRTLVIATDSVYVVEGATKWVRRWLKNGWINSRGKPAKNKDLWENLLTGVEMLADEGVKVQFWRIPREHNVLADKLAKKATCERDVDEFCEMYD